MPGSLPKADYQIYADQLATLRYGSALWYASLVVFVRRVGDVGYIRDGGFHLLFNAAAPSGESGLDFPADLPILDVGRVTKRRRAPGAQKSAHITAFGAQAEMALENVPMNVLRAGGGFVVESQVREGAILLTKYDTHHKSWAQFANDSGHGIGPEDILLVTGRDMTADHTMLAFSQNDQRREMQLEVGISDIASASARWGRLSCQFPVLFRNQGPLRRIEPTSQEIAGTEEPERTQCVFLRAYRVYHRALFFRKVIQAGAGPHNPGPGQRFDDMGVSLFAAQDEDQFTDDGDDLVAITNVPKFRDPLEALARYLLENSSAELAVVHDDDLIPLKTEEPLSDLAIDEVAELVSRCALEVCTEDIEGLKGL
ncbi:hypothetical protein EW026_g997 [Hermanssonia centrifuga]|uniref:Uncharacterized protein n=1 Tax=Hermanssonia centrifuga TaxID=98765 RepID=A0A4V6S121_9APHY|nr:hypothetical protein EW026_g997 [Hermanssonia centrifuga]